MLRHLLHEGSIFANVREDSFADILKILKDNMNTLDDPIFVTDTLRNGVSLSCGYNKNLAVPQLRLMISRWGVQLPDGSVSCLIFFLLLPDKSHSSEIKLNIQKEIERILCDRFILERVKISETPEEVLEVLLREYGFTKEVLSLT